MDTDEATLIPDHSEAWSLAHYKRANSNMARAYIELRELAAKVSGGEHSAADRQRLHDICHANDL